MSAEKIRGRGAASNPVNRFEKTSYQQSEWDEPEDPSIHTVFLKDETRSIINYYELPELVRVAAPVYLKFTLRNAPGIYPSGGHLEALALSSARERVRRAAIGLGLLHRYYPDATSTP